MATPESLAAPDHSYGGHTSLLSLPASLWAPAMGGGGADTSNPGPCSGIFKAGEGGVHSRM